MKTIDRLVADLADLNIRLCADGKNLHVNAPTDALTAELQNELSERKPEILAFIDPGRSTIAPVTSVAHQDNPPLSFAQQRLWFLNQWAPNNPFYNISKSMSLSGPLDCSAFERSLREIVCRHDVLRTTFSSQDGQVRQRITERNDFEPTVIDLN